MANCLRLLNNNIHRIKSDAARGKPSKTRRTRLLLASRLKIMLADLGLTPESTGKMLHVHPRTVRYWISGKTLIPYSSYRLLRILTGAELPCNGWDGWHMHSGMLWSPEGHGFKPNDSSWWGLLVRQARCFKIMYDREASKRGTGWAELAKSEPAPRDGQTSSNRADAPAGVDVPVTRHFSLMYETFTKNNKQTTFCQIPDFRVRYGQNLRKGGV